MLGTILCGCSKHEGNIEVKTQGGPREYETFCINGAAYYRDINNGYVFPAYDRDGKIKLCNN